MSELRRRLMMQGSGTKLRGYVINQTGTYTDPSAMIQNRDASIFQEIRNASHLYVGELVNGVLQCKQVSDADKTLYADGTSVVLDGNKDMFMKLPQFWWKVDVLNNNNDTIRISFSMEEQDGWDEWEGNTFIGVYKALSQSSKLYSRSGYTPTTSMRADYSCKYARNRGAGYRCITYESHRMMCLLCWGYAGTLDSQSVFGGYNVEDGTTGICDDLGMTDTTPNDTQHSGAVNFWGLENFWGWKEELIDNMRYVGSKRIKYIDLSDNDIRTISNCGTNQSSWRLISKMVLGQYADVVPASYITNGNTATYYADYGYLAGQTVGRYCTRCCPASDSSNGISTMYGGVSYNTTNANRTNRIQYEGSYIII